MIRVPLTLLAALLAAVFATPGAAKPAWDQTANVKTAAAHLAQMQRTQGALAAFQFIAACYRTHGLASNYSQAFEACIVQDYMHSSILAAVYQRLPKEARQKMRMPEPDELMSSMSQRVSAAFAQYKVPQKEARDLLKVVDKYGMPLLANVRQPDLDPGQGAIKPDDAPPDQNKQEPTQPDQAKPDGG